ncbi:MAG: GNAT family N-acetyltransferase [Merdibacter sp.]
MMIREAKKEENSIIADIWLMSMRSAHYGFKETYWTKQYKSIRIKYSQVRSDVYVYEDGGVLLGFGAYVRDSDMVRIFVAPGYQHKGIGSALLKFFEERYALLLPLLPPQCTGGQLSENRGYAIIEKRQNVDSAAEEYVFRKEKE